MNARQCGCGFQLQDPAAKTPPSRTLAGLRPGFVATQCLSLLQAFAAGAGGRHDSRQRSESAGLMGGLLEAFAKRTQALIEACRVIPEHRVPVLAIN